MIDFKTTSTEYHFMFFFKRVCWTLELSYCWVSSFIERSTSSSNREEFIHSAHSKLYLASLFKLNFSSVSSPNRSPLFVEEFKWEDLKVLQILPFCTAEASSKYSMTSIVLLNYKVLNTPPAEKKNQTRYYRITWLQKSNWLHKNKKAGHTFPYVMYSNKNISSCKILSVQCC